MSILDTIKKSVQTVASKLKQPYKSPGSEFPKPDIASAAKKFIAGGFPALKESATPATFKEAAKLGIQSAKTELLRPRTKEEGVDLALNFGPGVIGSIKTSVAKVAPTKAVTKTTSVAEKYVKEMVSKQKQAAISPVSKTIVSKAKNFIAQAKSKIVDSNSPIEDVLSSTVKKAKIKLLPSQDITNQIDRVYRAPTIAGQFAKDNGLVDVIKNVDDINNLDQYLIAKHAKNLVSKGIKTGRDLLKDNQLIDEFAPKYENLAQKVTQYSQKLLDYSVDSGLISPSLSEKLKVVYPDYVPMQRIFDEIEKSGFGGKAVASLSKQTAVQAIKGSEREIASPLESLLSKTNDVFLQGEKNKAAQILASYKSLPDNPFKLKRLFTGEKAQNTISVFENGEKVLYETTKEIAEAAKALNVQQLSLLGKIFALPVRVARLGITGLNLPFVASNVAKDQVSAFINSKNALKTSLANPVNFVKSLFAAVGHNDLYDDMVRAGGGGTSFDIARNQAATTIEKIRSSKGIGSKILYTIKHPSELLRAAEDIIGRSEELTRIQQFRGTREALLKQGLSKSEATTGAARAARENTVNFARRGEWGTVLNSTLLYLNAGIQGSRTFLRNLSTRPAQTITKLAVSVFTPMAITTAWNLNDPERKAVYEDIPDYEKEGNLIIIPENPTKNASGKWNVIKIPLSPEINKLASVPRRAIEQAFGLDPVRAGEIALALLGTAQPIGIQQTEEGGVDIPRTVANFATPQAIKPTLEAVTNQNFFTGYPQVSASLEKLSPELQVKDNTSGTARKIGGVLGVSPIKVESFIRGTVGGVGLQALNLSDKVLAKLDIIPRNQIGGQSVINAITARFSSAAGGATQKKQDQELKKIIQKQSDENFLKKQEAELLYAQLKELPKEEANAKAKEIKKKNPAVYEKLVDVVKTEKKGLTYDDRLLLQLQVTNGERSKFIWSKLKTIEDKELKNAYVEELKQKGILSDTVLKQLRELKAKDY